MSQGQDSVRNQVTSNAALFSAIRKKPKLISEDARCKKVEKCLREGANINAQDKNDQDNTALHMAVRRNYREIVQLLLSEGAKVNILNSEGKSPLDLAQDQQDQNLSSYILHLKTDQNFFGRFWEIA